MSSMNTTRLDSWWIEKRWLNERIIARIGQFAGQDFYGAQHYAASFIFEPMGYALGNLFTDFESFDPASTPAMEVRVVPLHNFYVKSMVEAEDRDPLAHNPTGLIPQFRGVPVSVSKIGFTPGKKAKTVRAFDTVESKAERLLRPLSVWRLLQSGKVHNSLGCSPVGRLPFVLDGEPGHLARGSKGCKGPGRYVCVRLESSRYQPQQHDAHGGAALQRAGASPDP
jgi:hypothetical protein